MKKAISLILVLTMAVSLVACGGKTAPETTPETTEMVEVLPATEATEAAETTEITETTEGTETTVVTAPVVEGPSADALAILENIWADYTEEEKFPIGGGDPDTFSMNAPGAFDMSKTESLSYTLLIPAEKLAEMDGAATMLHLMNGNTFSSGVFHMTEGTDLTAFASEMKDIIKNNPFVCGFPERMLLAVIDGEYLLISFGNGEIMDNFQNHLTAVYPETEVLHTDSII